jgi:glycopeptide antibiotics resistance protein
MGSSSVKTVVVRRLTTVLLLAAVTVGIALATLWLSGKAYSKVDPVPFHDLRVLKDRLAEGPVPVPTFVALVSPMILNLLLFLPWGFLVFILLDRPDRPVPQTYLLTVVLAVGMSFAVEATQYFLPTRVTDINDVIFNALGAVLGAVLAHIHRRYRISFE